MAKRLFLSQSTPYWLRVLLRKMSWLFACNINCPIAIIGKNWQDKHYQYYQYFFTLMRIQLSEKECLLRRDNIRTI